MSRKEENSNMETRTTSELCSNSLPNRLPANGKVECWPADMRKIPPAKAGNMAIPFQSDLKIRPTPANKITVQPIIRSLLNNFFCPHLSAAPPFNFLFSIDYLLLVSNLS